MLRALGLGPTKPTGKSSFEALVTEQADALRIFPVRRREMLRKILQEAGDQRTRGFGRFDFARFRGPVRMSGAFVLKPGNGVVAQLGEFFPSLISALLMVLALLRKLPLENSLATVGARRITGLF